MTEERLPSEMPYKREEGACDICGREAPELRRVTLQPAQGGWGSFRAARVIYVCAAHSDIDVASEHPPSVRQMAPRTSRVNPQSETLW
jgi:hypothetical protein